MTLPDTMRASVLTRPRTIELQDRPVPAPSRGQVLVQVTAVGSCGSDTHFYLEGAIGDLVVRGPVVLGHETAGRIVAVGEGVDPSRIGARVAVEPQTPCRRCASCKAGSYHLCPDVDFYGAWPVDGSFSEYVLVDDDFAHPIPDSMSDEEGALVEPVSVAVHACRTAGVTAGSRVLVTGAGPIGVFIAQVARVFGATEVVVSDPVPERRAFAAAHGADRTVEPPALDEAELAEHFDVYLDASGNSRAVLSALPCIRRGGTAVLVGMGGADLTVPVALIQHREIVLTGIFRYVNTWPTAIDLVATGRVDAAPVVTGRFGLHEVEDALLEASRNPAAVKSMVIPGLSTKG